jgi:hypothetical protein
MIKVKPATGLKIRDPKTLKVIPAAGFVVKEMTTYWARRIACGDVVVIENEKNLETNQAGGA